MKNLMLCLLIIVCPFMFCNKRDSKPELEKYYETYRLIGTDKHGWVPVKELVGEELCAGIMFGTPNKNRLYLKLCNGVCKTFYIEPDADEFKLLPCYFTEIYIDSNNAEFNNDIFLVVKIRY
jgi:hypothetical protein